MGEYKKLYGIDRRFKEWLLRYEARIKNYGKIIQYVPSKLLHF